MDKAQVFAVGFVLSAALNTGIMALQPDARDICAQWVDPAAWRVDDGICERNDGEGWRSAGEE